MAVFARVLLAFALTGAASAAIPRAPLFFVESPLADLADEGLPFRLTVAFPAQLDPVTRALRATEARSTLGSGYAVVDDNFDTGTNTVRERGRDGLLLNFGRQTL